MSDTVIPRSSAGVPVQGLDTPTSSTSASTPGDKPRPPSSRRRDKAQLSCNACRRRKVRCDRLHPCSNCSSRGLGASCNYAAAAAPENVGPANPSAPAQSAMPGGRIHGAPANMQDRINHLESLVLSLMHETAVPTSHASLSGEDAALSPDQRADSCPARKAEDAELAAPEPQQDVSPSPSDYGSIRIQQTGVSYVGSSHWAAVLDSITDLRTHIAQEDEAQPCSSDLVQPLASLPRPRLFYNGAIHDTPASIVKSIPPRPVVDRLVSRYFNVLDIVPGAVHSGKFLREYEEFWREPLAMPIMWVGLLFSMMCLSTQLQQTFHGPAKTFPSLGHARNSSQATETQRTTLDTYKDKAIQCLLLGHYTKGGPYVLETLILYFLVECFHLKDMEIGIWVLVGNLVQIAMHMGYHKDAKHFANISPFAGEMRRRVWAVVLQLDFSTSTQLGLPRLVKESYTDTAPPRNLNDSDFNEHMAELPASRPDSDVTPTLYVLAKLRLLSVGTKVADVATEPRPHSYAEILALDRQIDEARDALPSSLRWKGLESALDVPSQIIIQRMWLQVTVLQLKIVLHRKFLEPSRLHRQYSQSRSACLNAAVEILDFQRLIHEETQPDGLLYQNRWRVSSAFMSNFLLATSILCYCLQTRSDSAKEQLDATGGAPEADPVDADKIRQLLKTAQMIWTRQCAHSKEAREGVAALRYVLGDPSMTSEAHASHDAALPPSAASNFYFPGSLDFPPEYDLPGLPGLELEPANEWHTWPVFTTNMNNNVEQWAGASGFQQMDLSS